MRMISILVLVAFLTHITLAAFPNDLWAQTRLERQAKEEVVKDPPVVAPAEAEDYAGCFQEGAWTARHNVSSGKWFAGGLASGLTLGLVGTAIIWGAARGEDELTPIYYGERSGDCLVGFLDGYQERAKDKRSSAALYGSLLGTAITSFIFLLTWD